MDLEWVATEPDTRRLSHGARRSTVEDYEARIEALRALGEGYSEVSRADRAYPHVAMSFRRPYAVVHQWPNENEIFLLAGDSVIDDHDVVLLPGLESDTPFSGAFVLSADHAWDLVKSFIRSGSVDDLGEWYVL